MAVSAKVVIVNVSLTQPIVSTTFVAVEYDQELVHLTFTVCQFVTVQATEVYAHQLIEYSHHVTEIADAVFIHETVIVSEVITVFRAIFV